MGNYCNCLEQSFKEKEEFLTTEVPFSPISSINLPKNIPEHGHSPSPKPYRVYKRGSVKIFIY